MTVYHYIVIEVLVLFVFLLLFEFKMFDFIESLSLPESFNVVNIHIYFFNYILQYDVLVFLVQQVYTLKLAKWMYLF